MAREDLEIRVEETPGTAVVIRLQGPIDIANVASFRDAVRAHAAPKVILDLSGVPFIDSAGLGALIGARVHHQQGGRELILAGLNKQARTLLEMSKVLPYFVIVPSVQEAAAGQS